MSTANSMTPSLSRTSQSGLAVMAGTAIAYALVGWMSLRLAFPPGYASPFFPSAGIALVCVLSFGWRALPGVALGSIVISVLASSERGVAGIAQVLLPLAIAFGATAQAAAGAALVRRFIAQPLTLSEPRDIVLFFGLGGVLACFISSTVAAASLYLIRHQPLETLFFTWWTWGTGDTLGVLIGAPMMLTLVGRPRSEWSARRLTVGVSMAVAMVLMTIGIQQVGDWEENRTAASFERDAVHASSSLAGQLQYPLHALQALHGIFIASDEVTRDEMRRATSTWVTAGEHLQAMGWSEQVARADVPAYEARVRAKDFPDYRVFNRTDFDYKPAPDEPVMALRYIEPADLNAAALGVNGRSVPMAREAIDAAIRTNAPVASAGFRATQNAHDETSVVIFRALYRGSPTSVSERLASVQGVVFVTLQTEEALNAFASTLPHYLTLCIVDNDPSVQHKRLAGPAGCETQQAELLHVRPLPFAGRQWDLRVLARRTELPDARGRSTLLFSLVGLLAIAMLGTLLLTFTGRTRRIEAAVTDRTLALQREIAERERTEADLRNSEHRFRNILNNVPIGVVYTDLHGNVKQVNPRFCELTGYIAEELTTMNVAALTHPDDRAQDFVLSGQLVHGEIPMYRRQLRYITHDNRMVWVQSVVSLLRDPQGNPYRIVGVVEDITEHMRLADAERAREIAEAANLAKSEFLSRMSHELRTPLNAMLGFAQLLELDQSHPLPASQRPWVMQIQSAGWHLLDMINDVLDLSRIESGTLNLQPDALDLRQLIVATLSLVEQDARRRGITVTQNIADPNARVIGDTTRVKQILINLLSNAVKYNSEGGLIHIETRSGPRDSIDISVTDTGLGMTPQQLSHLFQPFNRLGRERSSLEGTGIGLVISQRLAELMGGALRARSTAGEGSSFILSLPRAERPDTLPMGLDEARMASSDYHQRTVHYVEDNETNVEVMRGILSRRPQVRFEVSLTGLEGLAAIRERLPDLILLDMHLPDIDGMDLLRQLKSNSATADIPVVVVSADALADQIEAARQAGAQQYLTKPVSVAELLSVVDGVLDSAETRFG